MSTVTPQTAKKPFPSTAPRSAFSASSTKKQLAPKGNQVFLFDKENYKWMLGGVALILIGMFLLSGGKSPDPHAYNYDEIYSFRRVTLAPIVIIAGFVLEVFAIMRKPKHSATVAPDDQSVA